MNVAVLGASKKPDRYSYKAVKMLIEKGHVPFPVHPRLDNIEGITAYDGLQKINEPIDTITVYLSEANSDRVAESILQSSARRVIFNPGAENPGLGARLRSKGIEVVEACTLVLLSTDQF